MTTDKDLEAVKQQLAAKEAECATLKGQLNNTQHDNVAEAVHNKVQESVCKVSTMINVNLNFKKHTKNITKIPQPHFLLQRCQYN